MALTVDIQKKIGAFNLSVKFTEENEILALLGASGSGKSMTLKCIAGLETPDSGQIILNKRVLFDSRRKVNLPPQKRRVGYLFQQYALFPNMTVFDNILAGVRSGHVAEKHKIVKDKIAQFKLDGLEHKKPPYLSGGQQQRVALARILVNAPELILLDEPFSALDSYLKWQMEMELSDTLASFSGNVIYVSHNRNEVYRLCDSVCVLTNGQSDPKETIDGLFHSPATVSAAMISGCKNISAITKKDAHTAVCNDWGFSLKTKDAILDQAGYIGIRAHHLTFSPNENKIQCTVSRVVDNMFSTVVMLKTPGGALIRAEMEKSVWASQKNKENLTVYVDPKNVMVLK